MLKSACCSSLDRADEENLEVIAFSLLSTGIFLGQQSREKVLHIGMKSICDHVGQNFGSKFNNLLDVHMCGYGINSAYDLVSIAIDMGLEETE